MNEHSPMFGKIKKWYDDGIWKKFMVKNAVKMGKITADEYKEITGDDYEQ